MLSSDDGRAEALVLVGEEFPARPDVATAVAELRRCGVAVGVVTGRPLHGLALAAGDETAAGPLVVAASGGVEREVHADGRRTTVAPDDRDPLAFVLDTLATHGVSPSHAAVVEESAVGGDGVASALEDQLRRRRDGELPPATLEPGWGITVEDDDPTLAHLREALVTLADGRIGIRGTGVVDHPTLSGGWVAAGGVYEGEGPAERLLTAPIGVILPCDLAPGGRIRRLLDLRAGVLHEELEAGDRVVRSARFASLARPGLVGLRLHCPAPRDGPWLHPPSDDPVLDQGTEEDVQWMRVAGKAGGGVAAAATQATSTAGPATVLDRVVVYEADAHALPEAGTAVERARAAAAIGFDRLLAEHRAAWARRWEDADISIEGDPDLQVATRFALFHLMASVPETGEAAVGARGLSGHGYRGHVFWDADTFTLPFLAATHPPAARAMLEYRLRRLDAALEAARAAGRAGARFPWESARTGHDVTPTSFRDRSGATIPIRTGALEEHIVAQVPLAAQVYVDWTGDEEFARGPLVRMLVETARYWASRIQVDGRGNAHIHDVIGPDEYHESVDDNAFTNVMARWNLRAAARAATGAAPEAIDGEGPVGADEVATWLRLADALVDGYDGDTGVYEQFAGFHQLEPLLIAETAPRRPIAADLLLGHDRVRRTQVVKQADVLMLHHLLPDEVEPDSLEPNLRFYEPRTAHGSSLSPGIHAALFARARDHERALASLRLAARMDLDDLTETTSGGLHLATMGSLWQALALGYGGLRPTGDRLRMDPRLPPDWTAMEVRVRFRGSRVRVRRDRVALSVSADPPADLLVGSTPCTAGPEPLELRRRGSTWEVVG